MKNILIILLVLAACGRKNDHDDNRQSADQPSTLQSMALDSKADLPACTQANQKQLVYVKAEAKFFSCVNDWEEITIKGEKGDKGSNGTNGTATVMTNTMWFDSQTGFTWSIGQNATFDTALTSCSGGYRQPSSTELLAAVQHGLGTAAQLIAGPTVAWSSTVYSPTYGWFVNLTGTPTLQTDLKTTSKGIFCLK